MFTLKQENEWLCHLEISSDTSCWIWSSTCKCGNNIMAHKWKYLLHTLQMYPHEDVAVLISALCDSGVSTWIVIVTGPVPVRLRKFQSTLYIWIVCSDLLDLFAIKDTFMLRQTSWCSLNVLLCAIVFSLKKGRWVSSWVPLEWVWALTSTPSLHKEPVSVNYTVHQRLVTYFCYCLERVNLSLVRLACELKSIK